MAAMHREISGTGVHCLHACIHTCTHTLLEGTLMWTQVVHVHTTRVSSADNRNSKHKQVVRPYKCMSQYRSADISGVGNLQKNRNRNGKLNKTKRNKHILAQKTLSLPTSRWPTIRLGYTAYNYPTAARSLCW